VLRPQDANGGTPPHVERSCEYIEYAVVDSQQEVVLQFEGLGEVLKIPHRKKLNHVTKQSQKPRNNETAVKKREVLEKKPVSVPLYSPQIPHTVQQNQISGSAVFQSCCGADVTESHLSNFFLILPIISFQV
jgi:hypothetical protein